MDLNDDLIYIIFTIVIKQGYGKRFYILRRISVVN
jgi:hypothetical protein